MSGDKPREQPPRGRPLGVGTVRNLAAISGVYRAVLKDSLDLIETATVENVHIMQAYDNLIAILKVALDPRAPGSVPSIERACNLLLGEPEPPERA